MILHKATTPFDPFPSRSGLLFAPRLSQQCQREDRTVLANDIAERDLTQFLLEQRLLDVERGLTEVRQSVAALQSNSTRSQPYERQADRGTQLVSLIGRIREMSESLFPGPVTIDYASDPEDRSHEYIVFDVVAKGEYAAYRDRVMEWHDEVEKIVPNNAGEFRVIVHPQL